MNRPFSYSTKSLDRALFLYNFIREVRSSGVRGSITIMQIRKFFKVHHNIVRFRFFFRIAKRSIDYYQEVNFVKTVENEAFENTFQSGKTSKTETFAIAAL